MSNFIWEKNLFTPWYKKGGVAIRGVASLTQRWMVTQVVFESIPCVDAKNGSSLNVDPSKCGIVMSIEVSHMKTSEHCSSLVHHIGWDNRTSIKGKMCIPWGGGEWFERLLHPLTCFLIIAKSAMQSGCAGYHCTRHNHWPLRVASKTTGDHSNLLATKAITQRFLVPLVFMTNLTQS